MRHGQSVAVIIPALNEEQALGRVICDIPEWVDTVIVADNGSTDGTRQVAERCGATVVCEPDRGYGAACQRGLSALNNEDIIVFLDGDYSDHPQEMATLVDPVARKGIDLVIGSRVIDDPGAGGLGAHQRFGNWLACHLINLIFGQRYTDLGPFRAIRRTALLRLGMQDRAYGWTVEMQIRAVRAGLSVLEVPVRYRPRIGVSKISGTIKGSVQAGATILRVIGQSAFQTKLSG